MRNLRCFVHKQKDSKVTNFHLSLFHLSHVESVRSKKVSFLNDIIEKLIFNQFKTGEKCLNPKHELMRGPLAPRDHYGLPEVLNFMSGVFSKLLYQLYRLIIYFCFIYA